MPITQQTTERLDWITPKLIIDKLGRLSNERRLTVVVSQRFGILQPAARRLVLQAFYRKTIGDAQNDLNAYRAGQNPGKSGDSDE